MVGKKRVIEMRSFILKLIPFDGFVWKGTYLLNSDKNHMRKRVLSVYTEQYIWHENKLDKYFGKQ